MSDLIKVSNFSDWCKAHGHDENDPKRHPDTPIKARLEQLRDQYQRHMERQKELEELCKDCKDKDGKPVAPGDKVSITFTVSTIRLAPEGRGVEVVLSYGDDINNHDQCCLSTKVQLVAKASGIQIAKG